MSNYIILGILLTVFIVFFAIIFLVFIIKIGYIIYYKKKKDNEKQIDEIDEFNKLYQVFLEKKTKKSRKAYEEFALRSQNDEVNKMFVDNCFDELFGKSLIKIDSVFAVDNLTFSNEFEENKALKHLEKLIRQVLIKKNFASISEMFLNIDRLIIYFEPKLVVEKKDALAAFLNNLEIWESYYESAIRLNLSISKKINILFRIKELIKEDDIMKKKNFNSLVYALKNELPEFEKEYSERLGSLIFDIDEQA